MLARYEDELPRARQAFELQHLDVQWGEIQKLRAELVNPVRVARHRFQAGGAQALDGRAACPRPCSRAVDARSSASTI